MTVSEQENYISSISNSAFLETGTERHCSGIKFAKLPDGNGQEK